MHDAIQAGDTDVEITFIYTAAGAIDFPGEFAVTVPTEWGAAPTAASYEVEYQDDMGNALTGTAQSVERSRSVRSGYDGYDQRGCQSANRCWESGCVHLHVRRTCYSGYLRVHRVLRW